MLLNDLISKKYQKRRFFAGQERNNLNLERKFKIAKIYYFNFFQSNIQKFQFIMTIKNYLIDQYKNSSKLKINHSYLIEQFHDYKKNF